MILISISFSLTGCATLLGKRQTVTVVSDVDGAKVYNGRKYVGDTPLEFNTKKAKSTISVSKEGYEKQTINTDIEPRDVNLLNIFTLCVGYLVDGIAGTTKRFTKTDYFVSLENPEINEAYNAVHRNYSDMFWEQYAANLSTAMPAALEQIEANNALAAQQQAEKERQWAAERAAQQQQAQQRAQALAQQNVRGTSSMSTQQSSSSSSSQGDVSDLFTSDPVWNRQVQLWAMQYGAAKTRELVAQQRVAQLTERESLYASQQQTQATQSTSGQNVERVISAVKSNREQIFIKVKGNAVIAYSNKIEFGNRVWVSVMNGWIQRCGSGTMHHTGGLDYEFTHMAEFNGMRVYFNL